MSGIASNVAAWWLEKMIMNSLFQSHWFDICLPENDKITLQQKVSRRLN